MTRELYFVFHITNFHHNSAMFETQNLTDNKPPIITFSPTPNKPINGKPFQKETIKGTP